MKADRATALKLILAHEGGKVDHPKDPGGRTNKGITQRVYTAYLKAKGQASRDVWSITDAEVDDIYRKQYLDPVRFDDIPLGLNYAVADFAVNSGVSRAVKTLQSVLNTGIAARDRLKEDGQIGEKTLARLRSIATAGTEASIDLIEHYCEARMSFLRRLKTWKTFGVGWTRRVEGRNYGAQVGDNGVIDYAIAMLGPTAALPAPRFIGFYDGEAPGKGEAEDIKVTATVEGVGLSAAGAATVAVGLREIADQLTPLVGLPGVGDMVTVVSAVLGAGAALLLVYSSVQNLWAKRANG